MPPLPLIQSPSPRPSSDKAAHGTPPQLFRAVDFDHLIIHGQHYTWNTWQNTGRWAYPTCQPVEDRFIELHPLLFVDFVDGRRGER